MGTLERVRRFAAVFKNIDKQIASLKKETKALERSIGYNNLELITASELVISQQQILDRTYTAKVIYAKNDEEVEIHLKEFEELFYNTVLDYKNALQGLR